MSFKSCGYYVSNESKEYRCAYLETILSESDDERLKRLCNEIQELADKKGCGFKKMYSLIIKKRYE
jgi:hypothetical protein